MVTYSVRCGRCGKEMLFEQAKRMNDPGELPAFCSDDCSRQFGKQVMAHFVEQGAMMVDLDCGCFAVVHSVEGNGSTMPWMICSKAAGGFRNYSAHSNHVHREAVRIARQRLRDAAEN